MKLKMTIWAAGILIVAALLAGCEVGEPVEAPHPTPTAISPSVEELPGGEKRGLRVLQQLDGVSYGSGSAEGFYSICIDARANDSTNILYVDYASQRQMPLCSKPNCSHMSEACTSWVAHAGDGVFPMYANGYLYLIFKGSEQRNEPGYIQKFERDGTYIADIVTLNANEMLAKPYVTDEQYLYCNKIAVSEQGQVLRSIIKLNLETGAQTELYPATEGMIPSILGASTDCLIVESFGDMTNPAEMECTLYTLGTDGALSEPIASWNTGSMIRWIAGGTIYLLEKGTATLRSIDVQARMQQELEVKQLEQENVIKGSVRFVQGTSDTVTLSYEKQNENLRPYWVLVRPSSGESVEFELAYPANGALQHMFIITELEEQYLIATGERNVQQYVAGADGALGQVSSTVTQWALINKEDYWNSKNNYTVIEPFQFEQ